MIKQGLFYFLYNMKNYNGTVIIAGAGPGDPDLISVKALKHLQRADVILIDRLVSPELVKENAKTDAEIVYVGKQCSKGIHTSQTLTNELMVKYAQENKYVLRLKGGDVSLFSNVLDELEYLQEANIPYEIIPGISAAFGAAAYTGIPLTARGFSRGVRFLTIHSLDFVESKQWEEWATTEDTLVFYMSGQKINTLAQLLLQNNIDLDKKIAVIQQATTPEQHTQIFDFKQLEEETIDFSYVPTLLIVGKVVNLYDKNKWILEKVLTASYFDQPINTASLC